MKPLISVIIPVYNTEEYLSECLNSVLNQTLSNIEIICINDGSADKSLDILNQYAQSDKRIILFSQQNKGPATARNLGINNASGEYIIFMDADDYYPESNTLEKLYTAITANNVLICGGSMCIFKPEDKIQTADFSGINSGFTFGKNEKKLYSDYQFDYGYTRFLFNRNFLIENNILFPNYKSFEDPPFFVRAMIKAKEFYSISDIVYMYRKYQKENIFLNVEKNIDMIKGVLENLDLAIENNLYTLYDLTLSRLLGCRSHFAKIKNLDFLNMLFKVYYKLINCDEVKLINNKFIHYLYSYVYNEKKSFSCRLRRFMHDSKKNLLKFIFKTRKTIKQA
jgi:glycosyltransferase involved in cell wall biosynthesis